MLAVTILSLVSVFQKLISEYSTFQNTLVKSYMRGLRQPELWLGKDRELMVDSKGG